MTRGGQLALRFPEVAEFAAADFMETAATREVGLWLGQPELWPAGRLLIWGEPGCGKSHLLHAWASRHAARLLSGPALRGLPEIDGCRLAAVDDADRGEDEAALLHLLNTATERRIGLVLTSRRPPAQWPLRLPDLASRLRAAHAVEILPPDDLLLRMLLARRLHARQLAVPDALQDWLLLRLPRTPRAMNDAAARLDAMALASGTGVTRAMAARVVAEMERSPPTH